MLTAVVCDDDDVMRGVVRDLAEERGLKVLAETDHGIDVVDLVRRFDVDVVLLDLVLPDLSGEDVLVRLQEQGLRPWIVVFTAYDTDDARLRSLGVETILHKPDLSALGDAISELQRAGPSRPPSAGGATGAERRQPRREVQVDDPIWRSPSGVEPASALGTHLATCEPGDMVLAVAVDGLDGIAARFGDLLAHDCVLEVARSFSATLRSQDSLVQEPACEGLVLLLRGGDERAATAAWRRTQAKLAATGTGLTARAAWVTIVGSANEARARAVGAVLSSPANSLSQG
jgi:CheY-like chemotaxis protein